MESSIRDSWNFAAGESLRKIQDSSYLDVSRCIEYEDVIHVELTPVSGEPSSGSDSSGRCDRSRHQLQPFQPWPDQRPGDGHHRRVRHSGVKELTAVERSGRRQFHW